MKHFLLFICFFASICFGQDQITIGVSELESKGDLSIIDASQTAENIRSRIAKDGKFILIDANLMHEILKAQNISSCPSCSKKKCLIELGKMLYAKAMIGGTIEKTDNTIRVDLLAVDVETNSIIAVADSSFKTTRKVFFETSLSALVNSLLASIGFGAKTIANNTNIKKDNGNETNSQKSAFGSYAKAGGISALIAGVAVGGYFYMKSLKKRPTPAPEDGDVPMNNVPQHPTNP